MKTDQLKPGQIIVNMAFIPVVLWALSVAAVRAGGHSALLPVAGVQISELAPVNGEGYGYRIVYRVPADIDTFRRFKTDFDNDFLIKNRTITSHRLLRRNGNIAVTETSYSAAPGKRFIWETTTDAENHRMQFRLIAPGSSGQRYHWGFIQLIKDGHQTIVVQQAYFDFTGAGFWVVYPWQGGMRDVLRTNAAWEQKAIMRMQAAYR